MDEIKEFTVRTFTSDEGDPDEYVPGEVYSWTIATLNGIEYTRVNGVDEDGGEFDQRWWEQPSGRPVILERQIQLDDLVLTRSTN